MLGKCPKCSEVIDTAKVTPVSVTHDPVHHQTGERIDLGKETNKTDVQNVTEKHLGKIRQEAASMPDQDEQKEGMK